MRELFDFHAGQAVKRYQGLLQNFKGVYQSALSRDPTKSATREQFKTSLIDISRTFLETERFLIQQALDEVADKSILKLADSFSIKSGALTLSETSQDFVDQLGAFLIVELTTQIQRDVNELYRDMENYALRVDMLYKGTSMTLQEANSRILSETVSKSQFHSLDRLGRKVKSDKFVRTVYRQTFVSASFDIFVYEAGLLGAYSVTVIHPEGKKGVDGTELAFVGSTGIPTYESVKRDIFHPNTKSYLKANF